MSKWVLKLQGRGGRRKREGQEEIETDVSYHSESENMSLFALRLIHSRNYSLDAKCKSLSS